MTKKELKKEMLDFINSHDDYTKEEWYGTDRDVVGQIIEHFAEWLNIKLDKE